MGLALILVKNEEMRRKEVEMLNLNKLILATALTLFSVNASAYLLSEVGGLDTLIGYTTGVNGAEAEELWIEEVLTNIAGSTVDVDYTQLDSVATGYSDGSLWEFVTDDGEDGTVAFDFSPYNPEYYLVKVGYKDPANGNGDGPGTDYETFLYDNLASLQFAYISLSDFGDDVSLTNISVISHAGHTGDTSIPEPGVIGLLAIGLIGVGVARRRTKG
jgi:hypothetical protein